MPRQQHHAVLARKPPETPGVAGSIGPAVATKFPIVGRVWVTTRYGLQVCDQPGRVHAIIPTPNGKCANVTFGGTDFDTIYVTAGDKVYSRKVKSKGALPNLPPLKPGQPRL